MVILSKFAENLFLLMQEHNLKSPELAKILETDRTNITRYLQGKRLPSYSLFVKIVDFFNVSADVLLGRVDYCDTKTFHPVQPFGVVFRKVLDETHTSQYRIQKDLHFSSATTYSWLLDKRIPSMEHLDQLADYLDVSIDYLLGRIS
ncbi:MAG: helix-turn-helix transcriptional regulator [Clostridia bacterium]|nr:helix-turn-helix transcriptional regulator [Clostridia bacterium]